MLLLNQFSQTFVAKKLAFAVGGFGDAIRVEYENIAGVERDAPFVVLNILEITQGETGELDAIATAIFVEKRLRLTSVGHAQLLAALLPGGKAGGHEAALDATLPHNLIHLAQHFRGLKFQRREAAHDADRNRTVKRGSGAFSTDIAYRDTELLRAVAQKFVEVAANFASGKITRGDIQAEVFRGNRA